MKSNENVIMVHNLKPDEEASAALYRAITDKLGLQIVHTDELTGIIQRQDIEKIIFMAHNDFEKSLNLISQMKRSGKEVVVFSTYAMVEEQSAFQERGATFKPIPFKQSDLISILPN